MKKFAFSLIIGIVFTFLLGCTYSGPIEIVYHFNNNGDDLTVQYDDRDNINFYSDFSKEGYSFLGWYLDSELTNEVTEEDLTKIKDSSIDLYASWEKESFSISYYLPSGTLLFTEEYDYLDKVTAFTDLPEIEGYRFTGWNQIVPAKMPSNNVVLTAVYEMKEYQLIYHNPFLDYVVTKNVDFDAQLTLLVPTEPGYTFEGWYTDEALTSRFTGTNMPPSNVELYAKWSKTTFHIFFNSIDSTIYPPVDTTIDNIVTSLPSISLPGLVFEGWFYEGENLSAPFNYTFTKDITLTSRWSDSSGLVYEMFYSHAEICGYTGSASVVVFPNEVALHTVTLVQESAFEGNNTLEEIIGNEDLTTLETKSFANMPNLKSATFSFNTVNLGQNVFFNDTLIEELTISLNINMILPRFFGVNYVDIPDSFSRIIVSEGTTEVNESFVSSFFPHEITLYLPASWTEVTNELLGKATMTSLWVPRTITRIGTEAFAGGTLSEIVFEDDSTLTTIEYRAFWDANFVSITIPSSVTTIEPGAFMGCSDLVTITVSAENQSYIDEGGVLYNKDKTVLLKYPSASLSDTFTVPASVQIIEAYALSTSYNLRSIFFEAGSNLTEIKEFSFSSLRYIESIILPDGLLTIGNEAFRGMNNVNFILIPDSVVNIGDHIFNLTLAVKAVFIESNAPKEGWSEIAFEEELTLVYGYQRMVEENNAKFAISSNNEAILVGMLVDTVEGDYTIPETVLGYPVVKISSWAFLRTSIFGTLTIADNIVQIDSSAFTMAYATQIVFRSTSKLAYIRNGAFFSFGSTEMVLPNSVLVIESSAFYSAQINQIYIPSSVTEIGEYALSSYQINVILMESDVISNDIVSTWINPITHIYFNQENPYVVNNDYWTYE